MYTPGNILYFTPFYFPDGNPAKNKYFIVLKSNDGETLVASLPTRGDYIPSFLPKKHGCLNDDSINFNCYYFEQGVQITESKWGFPLDTYVYGSYVEEFNRPQFEDIYLIEGVDYEISGKLLDSELKELINCIKTSGCAKRRIRRALGEKI